MRPSIFTLLLLLDDEIGLVQSVEAVSPSERATSARDVSSPHHIAVPYIVPLSFADYSKRHHEKRPKHGPFVNPPTFKDLCVE
jgi:hypothetical protein